MENILRLRSADYNAGNVQMARILNGVGRTLRRACGGHPGQFLVAVKSGGVASPGSLR